MVLGKINCPVVSDTLEVLVMHLGRVAEADNRMDIENLGLLFGQVMIEMIQKHFIYSSKCPLQGLIWPDPTAPVDMQFFSGKL